MIQKTWPIWGWPVVIICSAVATRLVTLVLPSIVVQPIIVMWFLFVCPGMVLVRFFRIREVVAEWMLALALSIAIDAIVASVALYVGEWSPANILDILIGYCLIGAVGQLVVTYFIPPELPTRKHPSELPCVVKPYPERLNSLRRLPGKGRAKSSY
jgi:hypothetical protein